MKRFILVTLVAVLAGVVPMTSQGVNGTVEGVVLRADTSEPMGGVQIKLRYQEPDLPGGVVPPDISATTNPEGRFRINNVRPGTYLAEAHYKGYFGNFFGQTIEADVLEIDVPRRSQNLSFSLFPGGSIRGRVLDVNGQPAAGVSVALKRLGYGDGGNVLFIHEQEAAVNSQGEYHFAGLAPRSYYIRATRRVSPLSTTENSQVLAYFPGTADATRAEGVPVVAGKESRPPDFKLQTIPTVRVSGQIVIPRPLAPQVTMTNLAARTSFFLVPRDPGTPRDFGIHPPLHNLAKDSSNGQFEIYGVAKGSYSLVARIQIDSRHALDAGRTSIDVMESELKGVTLWLSPPTELHGRVVLDRDASNLLPKIREAYLNLWPADSFGGLNGAQVDANGAFTFPDVPDGRYRLNSVTALAVNACLTDIRQGGRSVLDDGILTVDRGKADPVELSIKAVCGRVQGIVVDSDGKPVKAAYVALIPDAPRRRNPGLYVRAESNAAGAFTLQGISPGAYKLFAWNVSPDGADQTPEFLSKVESRGLPVTVELGGSADVQVRAID
jgi:hypothetical protein